MKANGENADPEDPMARLVQEATNQSTPDKALENQPARRGRRRMARRRVKAPEA